jgi:hypothetical protein
MERKQIDIKNKLGEGLTFKISRFIEQIKKTKPHKHDEYYELIFLNEGEGFHCIEEEKYIVSIPEFYFLRPFYSVVHSFSDFQIHGINNTT